MVIKEKKFEDVFIEMNISYALVSNKTISDKKKEEMSNIYEILKKVRDSGLNNVKYYLQIEGDNLIEFEYNYNMNVTFTNSKKKDINTWLVRYKPVSNIIDVMENINYDKFAKHLIFKTNTDLKFLNNEKINIENLLNAIDPSATIRAINREFSSSETSSTEAEIIPYRHDWLKLLDFNNVDLKLNREKLGNIRYAQIILDVYEIKNLRFAKIIEPFNNSSKYILATPESKIYNYLDKNRIVYDWYFFDILENITENSLSLIDSTIGKAIKYNLLNNKKKTLITIKEISTGYSKYAMAELKAEQEQKIKNIKNQKYEFALQQLANGKGTFEKNGMLFHKDKLIYEGITLDVSKLYDFSKTLERYKIDEIADYNTIVNNTLIAIGTAFSSKDENEGRYSMDYDYRYKFYRAVNESIFKSTIVKLSLDNKNIVLTKDATRYYINNIRINKKELGECLTHILCHKDLKSFEDFLETVSKCSLKFAKAISGNIKGQAHVNGNYQSYEIKIVREKNKNYVVLGKEKYAIKDTNQLIDYSSTNMVSLALNIGKVTDVPPTKLKEFFGEAFKRALDALEKSKVLLDKTMKELDIKIKTIDGKTGYYVVGSSGREYLIVERTNDQPGTYEISNGTLDYRCIVNKSSKNQVGKDALVARLYALKNDSFIAKDVHTLKV